MFLKFPIFVIDEYLLFEISVILHIFVVHILSYHRLNNANNLRSMNYSRSIAVD